MNTDNGAMDKDGMGCAFWEYRPEMCGYSGYSALIFYYYSDDSDFSVLDMCCVCGGGHAEDSVVAGD
jgi:hypothetical protein